MRWLARMLIIFGVLSIVLPFFGLKLRSMDSSMIQSGENFTMGLILIVIGAVTVFILNQYENSKKG